MCILSLLFNIVLGSSSQNHKAKAKQKQKMEIKDIQIGTKK